MRSDNKVETCKYLQTNKLLAKKCEEKKPGKGNPFFYIFTSSNSYFKFKTILEKTPCINWILQDIKKVYSY